MTLHTQSRFRMDTLEERIAPLVDISANVDLTLNDPIQVGGSSGPNVTVDPNNFPDPDGEGGTDVRARV